MRRGCGGDMKGVWRCGGDKGVWLPTGGPWLRHCAYAHTRCVMRAPGAQNDPYVGKGSGGAAETRGRRASVLGRFQRYLTRCDKGGGARRTEVEGVLIETGKGVTEDILHYTR